MAEVLLVAFLNTVSQNKADEIIRSLEMNTKQSTDSLREMTDGIDLRRDAEELKFKFESGKLKDVSTQPTLLQSVHQLIEEGQKMHFHRFMETEKAQNTLWKTKKRIESTQSQIDNILAKKHGSSSHSLTLMSAILKLEAELFGAEISIKYIKGVIDDLRNQKREKQHALELLHKKYQKIQDFEALAQSKQLMIQNLVKENGSARVRLEQQCIELNAFVKKNLQSIGKDIQSASEKLQDSVAKEVETFAKMPIYQLRTVEFERGARQPVEELSIYRLEESKYLPGNVVIQSLLDKLEFCPYLAPEKLLDFVQNIKQEALDLETQIKLKSDLVDRQQVDSISSALDRVKDLCTDVNVSDAEQVECSIPVLNSGLSKATDALTSCLNLRSATQAWWDQPAQFLVPWIKEDELSLRQWHDLWSVNAARLTQLQLAK